jgi:hypothetical protein
MAFAGLSALWEEQRGVVAPTGRQGVPGTPAEDVEEGLLRDVWHHQRLDSGPLEELALNRHLLDRGELRAWAGVSVQSFSSRSVISLNRTAELLRIG